MPRGELDEYLRQLPEVVEIISAGTVKLESPDEDYDDE
jgi:hypothetical protein